MKQDCCKYTAGDLREPVTFQRVTRTADGAGGWTETWAAISGAPVKAKVRQLSGGEVFRFNRTDAAVELMVVTRWVDGLTAADRVLIRSRAHNIRVLNNVDFADQWLETGVSGGVAI